MQRQKRQQFPKSQTLANRSCNRNEVFVKGFSADQKRELVRDLRNKYRGVRITSDSRGEYIVYEDETRNIRSTYLSPEHLVPKVRIVKPRPTKKTIDKGKVEESVRKYDAMGLVTKLDFSEIYNAPRTPKKIIQSLSPGRLNKLVSLRVPPPIQPQLKQELSPRKLTYSESAIIKPDDIQDIFDKDSLSRDSILIPNRTSSSLNLSLNSEEKKLKEEEKLNSFIDNLLSASYDNFDKIFESEIATLNQERIATLMIERFKRRKQELDEIAESNQLSTAQFLERYLYSDPKPQTPQPQAQTAQGQQNKTSQPKTKNSKGNFQRDAGIIARQIFFKDRLSESLFQEYQKTQTSLSVSQQGLPNKSEQSASQDRSQKSATSSSNIPNISRNISRDYVRSSSQNGLTQTFLDKFKGKFSERFREIYNQSISQSQSSSQLLQGQDLPDENSSVAIIAGAESLELVQDENPDDPRRRSGSSRASRTVVNHLFGSGVGGSTPPPRPSAVSALDLKGIGNGALNLSSVRFGDGTGRGSGRGGNVDTPRNNQSAPTTARGPGLNLAQETTRTSRSAPGQLENLETNESPRQFKDAVEIPVENVDQNLTNFIQNFIWKTSVQNGVEESQNHSQDQLDDSLDQSLAELPDQSQANSPKKLISRELEQIKQARIVGFMKQKFSKFKDEYQKSNPLNSQRQINPDLYRKFLFETDDQGDIPKTPRPARSNAKTVSVIFKALAICLVEAENNPNEIVKNPQSTESSTQSPPINDSSRISSQSDHGGNVMTEILKILDDQKQSNLGSESFEQQQFDVKQLTLDQENSVNQDQEGKIINHKNFTELLERLNGIVSIEDKREVAVGPLEAGAEVFKVDAKFVFLPQNQDPHPAKYEPDRRVEVKLGFVVLTPFEPSETLNNGDNKISSHPSPTQDPQNHPGGTEVGVEDEATPPPSPAQQNGSPSTIAALGAGRVSMARNEGVFLSMAQGYSDSEGDQAGGGKINRLDRSLLARFENGGSLNTSQDNTSVRPPAKIINIQTSKTTEPKIGEQQQPLTPFTANALFLPPGIEVSPLESPLSQTNEEEQKATASPASAASTKFPGSPATSGHSPTASLQTASPQELSPVATLNSLTSSPVSGSLEELASDSETASHPSSPALAGGSAVGSGGWAIEEVKADQLPFKYSIIPQDHQDQVNDKQNPKKNYDFFIQKSQDHEGENTENKKTKIAISKTKFENSEDNSFPMTDSIKEQKARESVKEAIIKAIEETKKSYHSNPQNSPSQEDQIYYDYLEIAIDVGGVKNKAYEFKNELKRKFKQENTELQIEESKIEDHFNKAQLLSENFQKIAKENFGIFTGRIGEAKSRVVGMRTKRIPIDLLNEVKREKFPPSTSPRDPDSPLASPRSMSPH